jgi:2-C-methyl-D-erythritol 2,4-cyclodiphosphate synthase
MTALPDQSETNVATSKSQRLRIGLGIDAHAFASVGSGRHLILGGVHVPYARGLLGHSDADVLAHAIADALLGAARLGDIGEHFPDNDPAFKDADSLELLAEATRLINAAGYRIVDVDAVIIAQEPRLAPFREQIREHLAAAMRVSIDQVGVKATTTEHLGFEGRGEGISAQAVTLLERSDESCTC